MFELFTAGYLHGKDAIVFNQMKYRIRIYYDYYNELWC